MIRIVFLGTPESAVPTLRELVRRYDIGLVITQPDRPRGRSKQPVPPPVKAFALDNAMTVAQPETATDLQAVISEHGPFDLGVVVAYGRILANEILAAPGAGMLNVHFSLLPRWRGAAPVARAVMAGDAMTGVTIIKIAEELDAGDVLTAQAVDVGPEENAGELTDRLAQIGARLVTQSIPGYLAGTTVPVPQSDDGLTYASKLTPRDRALEVSSSPEEFINKVRGLAPEPGAVLRIGGESYQVLAARLHEHRPEPGNWEAVEGVPVVAVGGGGVELVTVLPPGKKPMDGDAWLRGARVTSGRVT
jgi:methionyl-tRNA formyltransferase